MAELQQGTPQGARPGSPGLDTFPKLLLHHARLRPERPAMREKDFGIWQSWSWAEVARRSARLSPAASRLLGFKRGDKLAVIGDNRPRLYWAMAAAQALGGVPVPVYQDAIAGEMAVRPRPRRGALRRRRGPGAGRQAALECAERLPRLERIIYDDPRGLRHYDQPALMSLRRGAGGGPRLRRRASRVLRRRDRQGQAAATSRSSSTPRAPPASPRA